MDGLRSLIESRFWYAGGTWEPDFNIRGVPVACFQVVGGTGETVLAIRGVSVDWV